eukprot:2845910-Prymnesium_polylepis.1
MSRSRSLSHGAAHAPRAWATHTATWQRRARAAAQRSAARALPTEGERAPLSGGVALPSRRSHADGCESTTPPRRA